MAQCHRSERKHVAGIPHFQHVDGRPVQDHLAGGGTSHRSSRPTRGSRRRHGPLPAAGPLGTAGQFNAIHVQAIIRSGHQRTERLLGGKGTVGEGAYCLLFAVLLYFSGVNTT